jgi:hypothetical protein
VIDTSRLRNGMEVYSAGGRPLGRIEGVEADAVRVGGRYYRRAALGRLEGDRVYLAPQEADDGPDGGAAREQVVEAEDQDQVRVPVREERLEVGKRPTAPADTRSDTAATRPPCSNHNSHDHEGAQDP